MKIGITCYPTYGGSGVVATELGIELAARGHEIHFITYSQPFRLSGRESNIHFHEVVASNSPYSIRLLLKIGGSDRARGPVGGIHWHNLPGNRVEYVATDDARQKIPWVRATDATGKVTVFKLKNFTNDVSRMEVRTMDCMDCHNRPSHRYLSPERAVNQAMALGKINPGMPWIKTNAVYVLTRPYKRLIRL